LRVGKSPATAILGTHVVVVFFNIPVARPAREVPLILVTVVELVLLAEPSNELPALVTSPVRVPIVLAVVNLGAETIVITGVVVVVATVASELAEVTLVTVPLPALPLLAAVTSPLALTVMLAFVKEPTLEFTVARVRAVAPVASPV